MKVPERSYRAAFYWLDQFWLLYRPDFADDLPALLGAMALNDDDQPFDPACAGDWTAAVRQSGADDLTALVRFLQNGRMRGESDTRDISRLLTWIEDFPRSAEALWAEAEAAVGSPSLQVE